MAAPLTIQMEILPSGSQQSLAHKTSTLLTSARDGDWEKVTNILNESASSYHFITEPVDSDGRSVLHYACELKENKRAFEKAKEILDTADILASSQGQEDQFYDNDLPAFLDKAFLGEGNLPTSAIHIAANRKNKKLVELLIHNGANVNIPENGGDKEAIRIIYSKLPKVILDLFDSSLILTEDGEEDSEDLLNVQWDFTPITGVLPHLSENCDEDKLDWLRKSQTFLLSNALRQKELSRSDVVLHPLVQIFFYYKCRKFDWLITFSMIYHILWSLLSITFIALNARFPTSNEMALENVTLENDNPTNEGTFLSNWNHECMIMWTLYSVYACLYILTFIKECMELRYCPSLRYYWTQLENCGQWILLISVLLVGALSLAISWHEICREKFKGCLSLRWIVYATNVTSAMGIYCAGMLVLGQFNKTKTLGIYMEMLSKVTKNVLRFLLFFSPMILTYAVMFRLLMPEVPAFGAPWVVSKVMTMMAGEINYDDVFHGDDEVPLPGLTKFLFLCFVVTVIIVLQNLLIGLTLSDIEKLNKSAEEHHYAKQLEEIYLLENFLLLPKVKWLIVKMKLGKWLEGLMVEPIGPERAVNDSTEGFHHDPQPGRKLEELPHKIQKIIKKEWTKRLKKLSRKSLSDLTKNG